MVDSITAPEFRPYSAFMEAPVTTRNSPRALGEITFTASGTLIARSLASAPSKMKFVGLRALAVHFKIANRGARCLGRSARGLRYARLHTDLNQRVSPSVSGQQR